VTWKVIVTRKLRIYDLIIVEFLSYKFSKHLSVAEFVLQLMPPETTQECEVFERYNLALFDIVRSTM